MSRVAILRLKALVAAHGPLLVVCLGLLGMAMVGVAGWEYSNPPTTDITEQTHQRTIRSELHTSVIASGNTTMYAPGTELVDQPMYLRTSSSSVTIIQRTAVPKGESVQVEQSIAVQYQVKHDGTVFWEESRVLAKNVTATSSGTVVSKATFDVRDIESRVDELSTEIGDAGKIETRLVVSISYETARYSGEISKPVSMEISNRWYSIATPVLERTHGTPITRHKPIPTRNPVVYAIPGAIGTTMLVAAVGIAIGYRREFDRREINHRLHELRFEEWISSGSVTTEQEKATVSLDSLAGLVDTAIDTGNRVIYDESHNRYVVIDGEVVYQYHPDGFHFRTET